MELQPYSKHRLPSHLKALRIETNFPFDFNESSVENHPIEWTWDARIGNDVYYFQNIDRVKKFNGGSYMEKPVVNETEPRNVMEIQPYSQKRIPCDLKVRLHGREDQFDFFKPSVENHPVEWTWDTSIENEAYYFKNNDRIIKFNRGIYMRKFVVKGIEPMSHNQHFWEIQILSGPFSKIKIGIGTFRMFRSKLYFYTGFLYSGSKHHSHPKYFGIGEFNRGDIIGIHLDLWNGTLSLYKNKEYLGIVCKKGLKGITWYPIATAEAWYEKGKINLSRTHSFPSSLQFLCCSRLRDLIPNDKNVLDELQIPPGLKRFLKQNLSWLLNSRITKNHLYEQYFETYKHRPEGYFYPFPSYIPYTPYDW